MLVISRDSAFTYKDKADVLSAASPIAPKLANVTNPTRCSFEIANLTNGERVYEITLLSETGGLVPCSTGFSVMTEPFGDAVFDTLIVGADEIVRNLAPEPHATRPGLW